MEAITQGQERIMTAQTSFFSRIGGWFKTGQAEPAIPSQPEAAPETPRSDAGLPVVTGSLEPRSTFLRPWTRRDATIEQLQSGMLAMSEIMGTLRNTLERQSKRQDEMVEYLMLLPQILKQLPESARANRETLSAIQRQLEQNGMQQSQAARILDRISRADGEKRRALEAIQDRVEWINRNEHHLTQSLSNVGVMLQSLDNHSDISAQVLRQIRDGMTARDSSLLTRVRRHSRLTNLLLGGILLALGAFAATGFMGMISFNFLSHFVQ
jgi:hypothetical protein